MSDVPAAADNHGAGPAWNMHPIADAAFYALPIDWCGQAYTGDVVRDDGSKTHAFGHPEPIAEHLAAEVLRALDRWIAAGNTYDSLTALADEIEGVGR